MNARSAVRPALITSVFALSLGLVVGSVGCAPPAPPKQASSPDAIDPLLDSASEQPKSSGGSDPSGGSVDPLASPPPPPSGAVATGKDGEPPQVANLAHFLEGLKWGMGHAELTQVYTRTSGVIWKDFDERLAKARVGPEQTALEAERERSRNAFSRTRVEFKDTPTGYDTTGIAGEYTYKNNESLMWVERKGKKRFFFFINDRLWKIYDEIPLAEGGPLGGAFSDAVNRLNAQLNAQGRVRQPEPAKGIRATTVDWKDGANHLRVVDRSGDRLVGLVVEDSATLANLAALRPNTMGDPNEIDPSIAAVTQGTNRTDPNAPSATPEGADKADKKKPAPKKKK